MEKEILKYLAEYVANISPELWEITLAYIHAAAIQWFIAAGCFFVLALFLAWCEKRYNSDLDGTLYGYAAVLLIPVFVCVANAIGRLLSPEMYAVNYLLSRLP